MPSVDARTKSWSQQEQTVETCFTKTGSMRKMRWIGSMVPFVSTHMFPFDLAEVYLATHNFYWRTWPLHNQTLFFVNFVKNVAGVGRDQPRSVPSTTTWPFVNADSIRENTRAVSLLIPIEAHLHSGLTTDFHFYVNNNNNNRILNFKNAISNNEETFLEGSNKTKKSCEFTSSKPITLVSDSNTSHLERGVG